MNSNKHKMYRRFLFLVNLKKLLDNRLLFSGHWNLKPVPL